MKAFLQNLLIVLALGLCVLIAFQWVRETHRVKDIQDLNNQLQDKREVIQSIQAELKRDKDEIVRLDGLKNDLTQTVKSNNLQIASLGKELEQATNEVDRAQKQIAAYKDAMQTANDRINSQNEAIKKQNEEMAKLAEDRNEVVKKYNKIAADLNDLAKKWNAQQEELAKAATNAPAKK